MLIVLFLCFLTSFAFIIDSHFASSVIYKIDEIYFYVFNYHLALTPDIYNIFWAILSQRSLNSLPLIPILYSFFLYLREHNYDKKYFMDLISCIVFFEIAFISINYLCLNIIDVTRHSPSEVLPFFDLREYGTEGNCIKVSSNISLPSGHSFVLSFWYFFYRYLRPKAPSLWVGILASIFCLRRLIAGAHWFSDILAGCLLGLIISLLISNLRSIRIKIASNKLIC